MDEPKLNLQVALNAAVRAAKRHDAMLEKNLSLLLQKGEFGPLVEGLTKIPLSLFLEELRAAGFQGKKDFCKKLLELEKEVEGEPGHKKFLWKAFLAGAQNLEDEKNVILYMEKLIEGREKNRALFEAQAEFTAIPNGDRAIASLTSLTDRVKNEKNGLFFAAAVQSLLVNKESRNGILLAVCFLKDEKEIQAAIKAIADTVWNAFIGTGEEQKKIFDRIVEAEGKNRELAEADFKAFELYALNKVLNERVVMACSILDFAHMGEEKLVEKHGDGEGMKIANYWGLNVISAAKNISECVDCLRGGYTAAELEQMRNQFRRFYWDIVGRPTLIDI